MAKKKVALVLSGGSSLGSYIAGALDELLKSFAADGDGWEIDIITGASAGATTAGLIAHGLMYRVGHTALHDIWVDKIDIADLLRPNIPDGEPLSLLDGMRLQELALETLSWNDPNSRGERAPFCARRLTVAMTLANTSSLPYVSSVRVKAAGREENFVQYRNSEQETFVLEESLLPVDPLWKRLADVARASAAIPFVFPMVPLSRRANDRLHYIHTPGFEGEARFWYVDGGTFNNLPISLAWHYALRAEGDLKDRVIVVVNPWRSGIATPGPAPMRPTLVQHVFGLLGAMRNESTAIQFQGDAGLPLQPEEGPTEYAIPGVDNPPVEALGNLALVMPTQEDPRLRGNHLHALGAFLERGFREYDFRRGAADARRMARETLGIKYKSPRPEGYYEPDEDPAFRQDIEEYEALDGIPSSRDPRKSVRRAFEEALDGRIEALIKQWDAPGPDLLSDPLVAAFIKRYAREQLPGAWGL